MTWLFFFCLQPFYSFLNDRCLICFMARNTYCMKKAPAFPLRERDWVRKHMWYSLLVAEHPPLLKANYKCIYGGLSSRTWNIACNLKVSVLSQQLVCYFGVWQLKVVRERSDFPVTPTICFIPMFTEVFAHFSAPKAAHGDEAFTTPPCQQKKRSSFLSMPLPLPSAQFSILPSATCVTGQGAGAALIAVQGQKRRKEKKAGARKKIPSPLMVLRSASAKAIRHVASPKVSLFPSLGG